MKCYIYDKKTKKIKCALEKVKEINEKRIVFENNDICDIGEGMDSIASDSEFELGDTMTNNGVNPNELEKEVAKKSDLEVMQDIIDCLILGINIDAQYLARRIEAEKLDYKTIFGKSKLAKSKAEVDLILIADGFEDKIVVL